MKRWSSNSDVHTQIENEQVDDFLQEIKSVCKKHGFSIGHEDTHGGFLIERYEDKNIDWLMAASIGHSFDKQHGRAYVQTKHGWKVAEEK